MAKDSRAIIYTITCFQKVEMDDKGWLRTGASRTFGYFAEKDDAVEAMHHNTLDMWEYLYDYAVIEAMREGVHCECEEEIWFQYDRKRGGFFEIPKPEAVIKSHVCNFALG